MTEVLEHQRAAQSHRQRIGFPLSGDVRRAAVHRLEKRDAPGVDVSGSRDAEPAGEGRAQIGEDVAEEVVGDDHLIRLRLTDEIHRQRIDVHRFRLQRGMARAHLGENAPPEAVAEEEHVGLVGQAHARKPALPGVLEGGLADPLHATARVDLDFLRDLVGGALPEDTADARVESLGVLAKEGEAQICAPLALERRQAIVEEQARPQVDVEVELEAHREEDALGVLVPRNARIAHRAEIDRGKLLAQRLHETRRENGSIAQVALGAEVEPFEAERQAEAFQDAHADARHLGPDADAGDDRDALHGADPSLTYGGCHAWIRDPMPQRELEQQKPEVSAPPSWERSPWVPEERIAAQPEGQEQLALPLRLADQNEHVVYLFER